MALLAEELVEEWLNRKGFFTIRGIKLGVQEIDLLAIGFVDSTPICRHIEVTASMRPISYICALPKEVRRETGRSSNSAKRRDSSEISKGVEEWIQKKYKHPEKQRIREKLFNGPWTYELVVHNVKFEEELYEIEHQGIQIHRLNNIIAELSSSETIVPGAAGSNLLELVLIGKTDL